DLEWISKVRVNTQAVLRRAQHVQALKIPKDRWQAAWLLKAITLIDLTTLSGDDTPSNVQRLCLKAIQPVRRDLLQKMDMQRKEVTTAAVCVYPARVADAVSALKAANASLPVASVATGFPAGQTPLETRVEEVVRAVADGATEIDIVINRNLALTGQWEGILFHLRSSILTADGNLVGLFYKSASSLCPALYDELRQFRLACADAHMKTILAVGDLDNFTTVYKASLVAMMAGSDFIKTSTGKEAVNATFPVAIVMARAIRDYYLCTGYKVGFKPAGGIRTAQESLLWLALIKEELGSDWLCPHLFRIGASSLLADIERQIYHYVTGRYASFHELPMA
ncbi:unnamed protein product, partial [Tetraodon nigroviridis]